MKIMIRIIVPVFLMLLVSAGVVIALKNEVFIPISYSEVEQGNLLVRDKVDNTYTAVIMSYDGWVKFKEAYPVKLELTKNDFDNSFYIVGFSDTILGITVDGFKQIVRSPSYFCLDIADTGIKYRLMKLADDNKKRSGYAVIKVTDKLIISHIIVREGVVGGLTKWFK